MTTAPPTTQQPQVDALERALRALPRTRAMAKLCAELRAYRRQQMRNVDALAAALRGLKGRETKIEVTR